jgi:hypothetical protein
LALKRLPEMAFGVLVAASISAFFLIQAIKVNDSFIYGESVVPAAFDPEHGRISSCVSKTHELIIYRQTELTFHAADSERVDVDIVKVSHPRGAAVATISANTEMAKDQSHVFVWHGRLSNGHVAANGSRYYYKVALPKQKRSFELTALPVQVITSPPAPRIVRIQMLRGSSRSTTMTTVGASSVRAVSSTTAPAAISAPHAKVRIYYSRGPYRRVWIDIYRSDGNRPQRVWHFAADRTGTWAIWNGEIDGKPAPAGTYRVGITAQNLACDQVRTPAVRLFDLS